MRVQHVAQAVKGWATAAPAAAEQTTMLDDAVTRLRWRLWRLWHGQTERAVTLVGNLLAELDADLDPVDSPPVRKVTTLLRALETYVAGQADLIIGAAARQRSEPISTATTESTVQRLLHRRMGTNQPMRWSPRGAPDAESAHRRDERHARLRARKGQRSYHTAAEPYARRPFRRAA